ncbi:hypothetical protein [Nocardiopsis alba]|uniref:hypothetical protein n=1 Tax=Nocardiopsis alba TaxID=53437 RepID=UPI0033A82AF8
MTNNRRFTISKTQRMITPLLLSLLLAQGCSTSDENSDRPENKEEPPIVPMEYVVFQAQALTLDRMFEEGDPEEVFANTRSEEAEDYLRNRGVITAIDNELSVETEISAWDDGFGSMTEISSGFDDVLRDNEVTWCGDTKNGKDFVADYIDLYWESFDTFEEYKKDISEYVDCNSGANT